jgi:hypothetical protein
VRGVHCRHFREAQTHFGRKQSGLRRGSGVRHDNHPRPFVSVRVPRRRLRRRSRFLARRTRSRAHGRDRRLSGAGGDRLRQQGGFLRPQRRSFGQRHHGRHLRFADGPAHVHGHAGKGSDLVLHPDARGRRLHLDRAGRDGRARLAAGRLRRQHARLPRADHRSHAVAEQRREADSHWHRQRLAHQQELPSGGHRERKGDLHRLADQVDQLGLRSRGQAGRRTARAERGRRLLREMRTRSW